MTGEEKDQTAAFRELREQTNNQDADSRAQVGAAMYDMERIIGEKFRLLREERGWSQLDVAERLSRLGFRLHQTTIAKVERGKRPLRVAEAFALAQVFGIPPVAVFYMPTEGLPRDTEYMTMSLQALDHESERLQEDLQAHMGKLMEAMAETRLNRLRLIQAMQTASEEADRG